MLHSTLRRVSLVIAAPHQLFGVNVIHRNCINTGLSHPDGAVSLVHCNTVRSRHLFTGGGVSAARGEIHGGGLKHLGQAGACSAFIPHTNTAGQNRGATISECGVQVTVRIRQLIFTRKALVAGCGSGNVAARTVVLSSCCRRILGRERCGNSRERSSDDRDGACRCQKFMHRALVRISHYSSSMICNVSNSPFPTTEKGSEPAIRHTHSV